MKRFLLTLLFLLPLNTYALTPGEVQTIVEQAQESVQTLPQTQEEDIAIAIAVSLSMPKASLLPDTASTSSRLIIGALMRNNISPALPVIGAGVFSLEKMPCVKAEE